MLAIFGALVFAGCFAAIVGVFAFTLVPALPRIGALLRGQPDPALQPSSMLMLGTPRVRVRSRPMVETVSPLVLRAAA